MKRIIDSYVKVDVSWVETILKSWKSVFLKGTFQQRETLEFLRKIFIPYNILFFPANDNGLAPVNFKRIGIQSAGTADEGTIFVMCYSWLADSLRNGDNDTWKLFVSCLSDVIYHEVVHRIQIDKSKGRSSDTSAKKKDTQISYLSDVVEIQAWAQMAVFEMRQAGMKENQLKILISSNDYAVVKYAQTISQAFETYYTYFGNEINDIESSAYRNNVWSRFLKIMYRTINETKPK